MMMKSVFLSALSCFCIAGWLGGSSGVAAAGVDQCPTLFLPSDVLPSVQYNYSAPPFAEFIAHMHKTLPGVLEEGKFVAHAIAIVHRDEVVYSAGLTDTPFRIGSITKTFTAMGALILRERGMLSLDDSVTKFLPGFSVKNPYDNGKARKWKRRGITLRELMGHVSGLPRDLCGDSVRCLSLSEAEAMEAIAKMELICPPWSQWPAYSNIGFALLGHAWERVTSPRQSWSDFVRDEILMPLNMSRTGADVANVKFAPGDVGGYPANLSIGWLGPAGEMYSTTNDLAKYLKFLITPNTSILSPESVREWTHVNTLYSDNKGSGFALPWELQAATTAPSNMTSILITKGGSLGTYNSIIAFHPDTQLSIAVLTSSGPNTTGDPSDVATSILTDFIPVVESANFNIIRSLYTGVYVCESESSKGAIISPTTNQSVEVVGGTIEVTGLPSNGLQAQGNITLTGDKNHLLPQALTPAYLLLKNGTDHTFWAQPLFDSQGSCLNLVTRIGAYPAWVDSNTPGSVFLYELQFDPDSKLLRWPAVGAVCHKKAT